MTRRYTPQWVILTSQTTTIRPAFGIGIKALTVLLKTLRFTTLTPILVGGRKLTEWCDVALLFILFRFIGRNEFTAECTGIALEDGTHGMTAGIDVFGGVVAPLAATEERVAECIVGKALTVEFETAGSFAGA